MGFSVFSTFVVADFLFLVTGALMIGFALIEQNNKHAAPTTGTVVRNLLLEENPLTAAIINSGFIFFTFLVSIPGMVMPMTRGWLKLLGYMVVICGLFTLILGLDLWYNTLATRSRFAPIYASQSSTTQSIIQNALDCCGYTNSTSPPFVTDNICTDPTTAALKGGCISSFSSEANVILDQIFTAAFAIVGVDFAFIMSILMLLAVRKEKERYRHIDEKNGAGGF